MRDLPVTVRAKGSPIPPAIKKSSKKNRLLTKAAGSAVAGLIRAVKATSPALYEPPAFVEQLRANIPFIMAMWHGQFMMLADINTRECEVNAMVARHGDAEVVADVLGRFGIASIRGAGARGRKRDRGGAYALRAAVRSLENGAIVAMTADVPGAKPRVAGTGIVTLARMSGRPIIPVAAATSRYLVLNTWSRFTVNLPFSKLAFVAGDPIRVDPDVTDEELEQARVEVERSLNAATDRAYELARSGKPQRNSASPGKASRDTGTAELPEESTAAGPRD